MKTLPIIIIVGTLFLTGCAAPGTLTIPKNAQGNYQYQGVIEVPNQNSDALYAVAKEWVAINFRSAQDVIQLDDPENGQLVAKGYYPIMWAMHQRRIWHTLRIETRNGRYRYTINNFQFQTPGQSRIPLEEARVGEGLGGDLSSMIKETLSGLEAAMKKGKQEW